MNKKNLQRMADYIRTVPKENFNMRVCRFYDNDMSTPECNSVGCIIGHCTILDAANVIANFTGSNGCTYYDYDYDKANIRFVDWSEYFTGLTAESDEWAYLFSGNWAGRYDENTPEAAAKRIETLINSGLPENWRYDL